MTKIDSVEWGKIIIDGQEYKQVLENRIENFKNSASCRRV